MRSFVIIFCLIIVNVFINDAGAYTVKRGDCFYRLSRQFHIGSDEIVRQNAQYGFQQYCFINGRRIYNPEQSLKCHRYWYGLMPGMELSISPTAENRNDQTENEPDQKKNQKTIKKPEPTKKTTSDLEQHKDIDLVFKLHDAQSRIKELESMLIYKGAKKLLQENHELRDRLARTEKAMNRLRQDLKSQQQIIGQEPLAIITAEQLRQENEKLSQASLSLQSKLDEATQLLKDKDLHLDSMERALREMRERVSSLSHGALEKFSSSAIKNTAGKTQIKLEEQAALLLKLKQENQKLKNRVEKAEAQQELWQAAERLSLTEIAQIALAIIWLSLLFALIYIRKVGNREKAFGKGIIAAKDLKIKELEKRNQEYFSELKTSRKWKKELKVLVSQTDPRVDESTIMSEDFNFLEMISNDRTLEAVIYMWKQFSTQICPEKYPETLFLDDPKTSDIEHQILLLNLRQASKGVSKYKQLVQSSSKSVQ